MSSPTTHTSHTAPTAQTGHTHPGAVAGGDRARYEQRARLLAGASVTYNVIEAVIAVAAGLVAGSVALIGFGLDSVVEVSSGLIILWQFRRPLPESREQTALRLMAFSFFGLAAFVTFESVRSLVGGAAPEVSGVGIVLAAVSLVVMPFLSWAQRRTGRALGSNAVVADSTQTLLCTYMSAVLLVGLVLNATLGWSWADPVAGLVIAGIAVREGRQAWRGEGCCSPTRSTSSTSGATSGPDGTVTATDQGCGCTSGCCGPAEPADPTTSSKSPTGTESADPAESAEAAGLSARTDLGPIGTTRSGL